MRFTITSRIFATAGIVSSALALALALLGMPLLAVPAIALSLFSNSRMSKHDKVMVLDDLYMFVGNLLLNYSTGRSTVSIIKSSLDPGLVFYKKVHDALNAYRLSGSARLAFAWAGAYSSRLYKEVFFTLAESLESGTSILGPMKELHKSIGMAHSIQLKAAGGMANAMSIVGLGSVVFFPIFAGISYYIMGFSSGISGAVPMSFAVYAFIVIFYVAEISIYNNFHGAFDNISANSILTNIAVGALLFKVSYMFALNGIRW